MLAAGKLVLNVDTQAEINEPVSTPSLLYLAELWPVFIGGDIGRGNEQMMLGAEHRQLP